MRRVLGVTLIIVLSAASVACGAKRPVRTTPTRPPALPPLPVLAAHPIAGLMSLDWPPAPVPVSVVDLLAEAPEAPPARVVTERERVPEPPLPPPPVSEPPRLSTPDAPDEAAATRQVREKLDRARRALSVLTYESLSSDARAQYDTVVELIQQAEEALKARNFVFALKVADKADTLARRLGG